MRSVISISVLLFLSITVSGQNFGVDQPSPTEKLDVNGNIRSSTLTGSSQHLACDNNGVLKTLAYAYATGYNQADGGDNNYVSLRTLTFTKKEASTRLRLTYTDNMRTYCNVAGRCCQWRFLIDGANPPSGIMAYANYCSIAGDNMHHTRTNVGVCTGISAGTHTFAIYVESCPGYGGSDCYTGWNTTWLMEVKEVY